MGSLTFLAPAAGIIAASVAVPAILFFYFLKLKRRPVRVSTVRFWAAAAEDLQVNAPIRMIRPSWLLFLHLLIAGALCAAAARPAIRSEQAERGKVVILIDRSASMSATDAGPPEGPAMTRLEAARAGAETIVRSLDATGAQAMVVAFADRPVVLANFTPDRGALRKAIEQVLPTDQPARFDDALAMVGAFAAGSADNPDDRVSLVVISDGAAALDPARPAPRLGSVPTRLVRVGPKPGDEGGNIGIVAMSARRDYQDPGRLRVFVRLQSTERAGADAAVVCELDGVQPITRVIKFDPAATAVVEQSVTFDLRTTAASTVRVSLNRRDALAADNAVHATLAAARKPALWLVRPRGANTGADENLRVALETLDPAALRVFEGAMPDVPPPGDANAPDLVVIDRVSTPRLPPGVPTLSFGTGLPIEGLRVGAPAPSPGGFTQWDRNHPVMRFVTLGDVFLDAASAVFTDALAPGVTATPLAWAREGAVITLLQQAGVRRLLVGVDLTASNWTKDTSFPLFVANAVDHLTLRGEDNAARWFRTSETIELPAPPGMGAGDTVALAAEGGLRAEGTVSTESGVWLGVLPRAGLYRGGGLTAAVNLMDPVESECRTRDTIDVGAGTATSQSPESLAPREIWTWLVLGALLCLCLEWLLFAWRSRL